MKTTKFNYYAMINGIEVLVRTSTKANYKFAYLEWSCFRDTKEKVLKEIKRGCMYKYTDAVSCNKFAKNLGQEVPFTEEEVKKLYDDCTERWNNISKNIVEVYIK